MLIADRLRLTNNRPSGFDYLRILLACSVLWMHTVRTSYGLHVDASLWSTPLRPFLKIILPMFFALSGFLVAGSLERCRTLTTFLGLRLIRIYPALMVEVLLSALLLGPIYTAIPLSHYFSDRQFWIYLLNCTGDIHFNLPGVFLTNPDPGIVNAQLWTVPFELGCYVLISGLFLLGVLRRRAIAPISAVIIMIVDCIYRYHKYGPLWHHYPNVVPGIMLISSFMFGVSIYLYRDVLRWDMRMFFVCAVGSLSLFEFTGIGDLVTAAPIAYMTVYLGLTSPRRLAVIQGADYSYGIFLYGYPIQQAFAALGPWTHEWMLNGIACTVFAAGFAALSWRFVEKPTLRLKTRLVAMESRMAQVRRDPRPKEERQAG